MKRAGIVTVVTVLFCSLLVLAADGPSKTMVGTWKLDPAKSKYSPGPKPQSQIAKLEDADGGLKVASDRVEADGKTTHFEYTVKLDGKDYPVKGDPGRDTISVKKIDDYTLEMTNKKAGKVTTTIRAVYAKDGKSRAETATGTNAQGQKIENVTQWSKQ
jgi:hypothetical protein